MKRLLTIDDLVQYSKESSLVHFKAEKQQDAVVVSIPTTFSTVDYDDDCFKKIRLKACHTKLNRNGSYISEEVMDRAKETFVNKPILASIKEFEDKDGNSVLDFNGHDMAITTDKMDNSKERVEYVEQIVGIIPETCNMELVQEDDKSYLYVDGYIHKDYTYACDILEKRGSADVSVELAINEYAYNAKEKYLEFLDFKFLGVTLLGAHVEPGMKGAQVVFAEDYTEKFNALVDSVEELKTLFSTYHKENSMKGGQEVLETENNETIIEEVIEEVALEAEQEVEVEEVIETEEQVESEQEQIEETEEVEEEVVATEETTEEPVIEEMAEQAEETEEPTLEEVTEEVFENKTISFEVSHDDIKYALYNLIEKFDEIDEDCYYIMGVFDTYFIMNGYRHNKNYKVPYTVEGDNVVLGEGRIEIFAEYLTQEELDEVKAMRAEYSTLKETVSTYELAKEREAKEAVFADVAYEALSEVKEYQELKDNMDNFSIEEIQTKADLLFAKQVKTTGTFAMKATPDSESKKLMFSVSSVDSNEVDRTYGNLFNE